MKINRELLVQALGAVAPGLAKKDTIEQGRSVVLAGGVLYTFNDQVAVSHPIPLEGVEGAVPAEPLMKILGKMKDAEVDIMVRPATEGEEVCNQLVLKGVRAEATLTMEAEIKLSLDSLPADPKFVELPEGFAAAVGACLFSCSKDMSDPRLMCVHVFEGGVESGDGFRLTRYTMPNELPEMCLPASMADHMVDFAPTHCAVADGWAVFARDDMRFYARLFETEQGYPDFTSFLTAEKDPVELPKELCDMLDRAGVFGAGAVNDYESRVQVTFSKGLVAVSATGAAGTFKESVRCRYAGDDHGISVHPKFLQQMIAKHSKASLCSNRVVFTCENYIHTVYTE